MTIKIIDKCNDCGHYSNAENFRMIFGNFLIGRSKCPNCKSKNIEQNWCPPKPKAPPPAQGIKK